jgi:hypothetical protein
MTAINISYPPSHPITLQAAYVASLVTQNTSLGTTSPLGIAVAAQLRQARVEQVDMLMAAGRLDPALIIANTPQ